MTTVYVTPDHDTSMVNSPTELVDDTYNGWANYETWNVALWIQNDEGLYNWAREFRHRAHPYADFAMALREIDVIETPDEVAYNDSGLDHDELDAMMAEL